MYSLGQRLAKLDGGVKMYGAHPLDYGFNTSDIVTVFCQGNGASRHQAAKYAGPDGMDVRLYKESGRRFNKDTVSIANAPRILWNMYVWDELDDISYNRTWNPTHWAGMIAHAVMHKWGYNLRGMHTLPYNLPTRLNVAGEQDVEQYLKAVRDCITEHPTKRIVLFGTSRGASTVLVALRHLSPENRKHIALVLVEGPFDTMHHVTNWRYGHAAPLLRWLLKTFALYSETQKSPLDVVRDPHFPVNIPLGFIRSAVDTIVPPECTRTLFGALQQRGHPHLYELVLERSHHSRMPIDDEKDQEQYLRYVYDLYKRYIPLNPSGDDNIEK